MSGLIRIQTVWHSDGIPDFFPKKLIKKKNQQMTKNMKNYLVGKKLMDKANVNELDIK